VTELECNIANEIRNGGSIPFARFMELALYEPKLGYYRNGRDPFGVPGDFYTAEQLQPVFGEMVAAYTARCAEDAGGASDFSVLEIGAGRAELEPFLRRWRYVPFDFGRGALPKSVTGLVIANEFFDALPVHLLRKERNDWLELCVGLKGNEFVFVQSGEIPAELIEYARRYARDVEEGSIVEASLAALEWIACISRILDRGRLLVIDYGYEAKELRRFGQGSLIGYRRHQAKDDVLAAPGTKDITAHVNFTALRDAARRSGFLERKTCAFAEWARSLWDEEEFRLRWETANRRWRLQWKQLVFGLGETFRVMELKKQAGK